MLPLVFIDVDGTLVGSSGEPSTETWAAARRATDRGQHLALATARPAFGPTWDWARHLDPDGWHVFQTGSSLVHSGSGDVHHTPLVAGAAEALIEIAGERDWVLELYSDRDMTVDSDAPLAVEHAGLLGIPHRRRSHADLDGVIVRAQFVVPIPEGPAALAVAPAGTEGHSATSPAMTGAAFVSITNAGTTKSSGIATLAELAGVALADVMMVGDGNNDAEPVAAVGHGVTMGNAEPETLAVARHRVGDVDAGGLAEALDLSGELAPSSS